MMIAMLDRKNEIIEISSKYHDYTDVFDETNANELFEHRSHDHAIKTKILFFRFNL